MVDVIGKFRRLVFELFFQLNLSLFGLLAQLYEVAYSFGKSVALTAYAFRGDRKTGLFVVQL